MNSERELLRLKLSEEISSLKKIVAFDEAIDVAVARIGPDELIFVTTAPKVYGRSPRLVGFSLSGEHIGDWELPPWKGSFSGIAIDNEKRLAYVANGETSEIYMVDLGRVGSAPIRFARVRFGRALGAIALDTRRHRLLIADAEQGVIYSLDLSSRKVSELVNDVGEPLALTIDSKRDRLFIADNLNERIYVANLSGKGVKVEIFAAFKEIEEPLGLAVGSEGTLWVGDRESKAVFLISREGRLLRSVRP